MLANSIRKGLVNRWAFGRELDGLNLPCEWCKAWMNDVSEILKGCYEFRIGEWIIEVRPKILTEYSLFRRLHRTVKIALKFEVDEMTCTNL